MNEIKLRSRLVTAADASSMGIRRRKRGGAFERARSLIEKLKARRPLEDSTCWLFLFPTACGQLNYVARTEIAAARSFSIPARSPRSMMQSIAASSTSQHWAIRWFVGETCEKPTAYRRAHCKSTIRLSIAAGNAFLHGHDRAVCGLSYRSLVSLWLLGHPSKAASRTRINRLVMRGELRHAATLADALWFASANSD